MDFSIVRSAIETLYLDKATIIEYREVFNPDDCSTGIEEFVLCENQPCKVSYESTKEARDGSPVDGLYLIAKLFISNDIEIKAGSKIIVTRNGEDTVYRNSGEPARYYNHQEIKIRLWEDKA